MDLRRLRLGELLAGAGGVALVAALLLPWYGEGPEAVTGFEALTVIDVLLALIAAGALALPVVQVAQAGPAKPVAAAVLNVPVGVVGVLLVLFRLIDAPDVSGVRPGVYLGLAATVAIVAGAWRSMASEYSRGLPPDPEPDLRPTPAAGARS